MAAFVNYSYPFPNSTHCSFKPQKPKLNPIQSIPITDRIIDFGKYKGKMLGTLPSAYLKWVSKNLRAGDTEHWAKFADQVLQHPIYQDRLEWELADTVLSGNRNGVRSRNYEDGDAVSGLVEISARFGWDNGDRIGWGKVNFELLGTSKGGRIPRISESRVEDRVGGKATAVTAAEKGEESGGVLSESGERRRKERRERMKAKKEGAEIGIREKMKYRGSLVNLGGRESTNGEKIERRLQENESNDQDWKLETNNRFPGREGLLKNVLDRKKLL